MIGYLRDMMRCKPFFSNSCELSVVWAAFSERSYEGMRSRQMFEGTTKNASTQVSEQFLRNNRFIVIKEKKIIFLHI